MKSLWRNQTFLLITISDLLQNLAIWVRNMALLFFIMEQTNEDPIAVSTLTLAEYVPIFLFSFIGGALADRWNPKRTMIAGDMLSALSILLILLLISFDYWQAVFAAAFISAVVSQFSQPSSSRLLKRHLPEQHVAAAIGITQSLQSLFLIFGPMLGTLLYTKLGLSVSLYSLTLAFLLSACVLAFLPAWEEQGDRTEGALLQDIKEGWRYVFYTRDLYFLTCAFSIIGFASGLVQPLEVFLITERLGLEKEAVQYLSAAAGIGLLAGGAAAIFANKLHPKTILMGGILFLAIATTIEVLSTSLWLTSTMRFLSGAFLAVVNIVVGTFMIKLVPEHLVGRVNGTIMPVFMAAMLLGTALSGILMSFFSLISVFIVSSVCIALSVLTVSQMELQEGKQQSPSL